MSGMLLSMKVTMTHDHDCKSIVGGECDCGGYENLAAGNRAERNGLAGNAIVTRLSETMFTTGEVVEVDEFTMRNLIVRDAPPGSFNLPGKNYQIIGGETWIVGDPMAKGFKSILSMPNDTHVMRPQMIGEGYLFSNNKVEFSGDNYIQWRTHDNEFAHERFPSKRRTAPRKSIRIETCGFGQMPTLCKPPSIFSRIAAWWRKWTP